MSIVTPQSPVCRCPAAKLSTVSLFFYFPWVYFCIECVTFRFVVVFLTLCAFPFVFVSPAFPQFAAGPRPAHHQVQYLPLRYHPALIAWGVGVEGAHPLTRVEESSPGVATGTCITLLTALHC